MRPPYGSHPFKAVLGCLCARCGGPTGIYDPILDVEAVMLHWGTTREDAIAHVSELIAVGDQLVVEGVYVQALDGAYWRKWRLN
jgi:hypothetical protein